MTSDSLACWLARSAWTPVATRAREVGLGAGRDSGPTDPEALADAGILDAAFARLAAGYRGTIRCLGRGDTGRLRDFLSAEILERTLTEPEPTDWQDTEEPPRRQRWPGR